MKHKRTSRTRLKALRDAEVGGKSYRLDAVNRLAGQ
jgi:hypothetical protein